MPPRAGILISSKLIYHDVLLTTHTPSQITSAEPETTQSIKPTHLISKLISFLISAKPLKMPFTASDIFKIILAVILPPLGVFLERGCGPDLLINILLTILGYIPGIIHALYIIFKYWDPEVLQLSDNLYPKGQLTTIIQISIALRLSDFNLCVHEEPLWVLSLPRLHQDPLDTFWIETWEIPVH